MEKSRIGLLVLAVAVISIFSFCTFMKKEKEFDYDYENYSCYANGYKCDVVFGSRIGPVIISINSSSDWGAGGGLMAFTYRKRPVPDTIRLEYYSLPEDQFYRLTAALPQERIKELLDVSYPNPRGSGDLSFDSFTVGMAPCGYVVLWINGNAGNLLVDTFRAEKVEMNYKSVFPSRGWSREKAFAEYSVDLFSFIQQEMKEGSLSSQYWEDLNKTYPWKLRITDSDFEIYKYSVSTINIEHRNTNSFGSWLTTQGEKPIPAELILYLKHDKDPIKYKLHFIFEVDILSYNSTQSEEEQVLRHMNRNKQLMNLFETFYSQAGGEEVELVLDFNDEMTDVSAMLKTSTLEMEIPGCKVNIYASDKYKL